MIMQRVPFALLAVGLVLAGCTQQEASSAEAPADPDPIHGAWRIIETSRPGPDGATNSTPQPGLMIAIDGHYSLVSVNGTAPRTVLAANAAVGERAANLQVMTAQAGPYEVAGDMLTTRPIVAKNPGVMDAGSFTRLRIEVTGEALTTTQIEGDTGPTANPLTTKYARVGSPTSRSPIDGAWRTVSITTTGPEGTTNDSPEPGLRLYAGGHYSVLQLTRTRPAQFSANPTAQEQLDIWSALTANTGTFEVSGDVVRSVALVGMSPAVMAPGRAPAVRTFRISGDTLWLTQVANAAGPVANPITEKLVRAR
jgi:hypothetical protein